VSGSSKLRKVYPMPQAGLQAAKEFVSPEAFAALDRIFSSK
jgi:hypothetical protein